MISGEKLKQNAAIRDEITRTLKIFKESYKGFRAKTFLFKNKKEVWQNFFTVIEAIHKKDDWPENQILKYDDFIIGQVNLENCELNSAIEKLIEENKLFLPRLPASILQGSFRTFDDFFKPSKSLVSSIRWPSYWFMYQQDNIVERPKYEVIFSRDLPLFPSMFSAIDYFSSFDISRNNGWQNNCIFIFPVFKARINRIRIGSDITVIIETKELRAKDVSGKIVFYNDVSIVKPIDFIFDDYKQRIKKPPNFESFDLIIYENKSGVLLDRKHFPPTWHKKTEGVEIDLPEEEFKDLIENGETDNVEFKENLKNTNEFSKSVVAMANAKGGTVILGVSDDAEILGFFLKNKDQVTGILRENCNPFINVEISKKVIDEKHLVAIAVPDGEDKPYVLKNKGPYVRRNGTDRAMTRHELDEIYLKNKT